MAYALAIIAAMIAAVVGWFVTGAVTAWIAGLFGMSDFEGGRGMFAFLGVGPIGGLICMIATAWLVLRAGHGPMRLAPALGRMVAVLAAIALIVAAGIWLRLATIDTYTNTLPPELEFEIRVPASLAVSDPSALRVELHTDKNVGESYLADSWSPADDEHRVIAGGVPLAFKTSSRLLVVKVPGQPTRLFKLPLSRDPAATPTFGAWRRPDHIHADGDESVRPAPSDDPVELRYRVRIP